MPAILGLRGTGDWATDERPKNFREYILWREPNGSSPLLALMSKAKSEATSDPEFAWWEEQNAALVADINCAVATTTTALTMSSGALQFVAGDILMVDTEVTTTEPSEIIMVSTDPTSDTQLTVLRGRAGTTAVAITTTGQGALIRIGSAFGEGDGAPSASTRNPTKVSNYTQIFKTTYDITNTAKETSTRTGDPIKNDKKRKLFDHNVAMELAVLFNPAKSESETGTKGKPRRYTQGLKPFITTNSKTYTTTITEATLISDWAPVFNYTGSGSNNERMLLCGNDYLTKVNTIAKTGTQLRAEGTVRVYGMELNKWVIPQGTLYIKSHPLMNTTGTRWTKSAFVLDVAGLIYRYLRNRDTKFMDNIQANDEDRERGQWLTEMGLEVHHEKAMAYFGNFLGS